MDNTSAENGKYRRARALRVHFMGFAGVSVILLAVDLLMPGPAWFYWPVMAWGAVIGAHALYCKSLAVDEDWAERRAGDIRQKSYDIGHILDIEDSYKKTRSSNDTAET